MLSSHLALRQIIQNKRRCLDLSLFQEASRKICDCIAHTSWFQQSQHIAFYLSVRQEIDCAGLLQTAQALGKNCYLPACNFDETALSFLPYRSNDPLFPNRYGILEPEPQTPFPAADLDLVITPLVAFDLLKNRLGSGMGFYDRTFAFLLKAPAAKPLLVGLAYDFQQAAQLNPQIWDVPLNKIVTFAAESKNVLIVE